MNLNRFDLASLRLLVAAVDAGSLTAGAARLAISVPAASKRLRELEAVLGTRLVDRGKLGVSATRAGATLLAHARRLIGDLEQMAQAVADLRGDGREEVRIWANTSAVTGFLPDALARFAERRPHVRIELEEGLSEATVRAVRTGVADLGILGDNIPPVDLETRVCDVDTLVLIAARSHPCARLRAPRFDDLVGHDFVGLERGSALMRLFTLEAERRRAPLRLRLQLRSFEAICRMVVAGLGIAILPRRSVQPLARSLGLAIRTLDEPWAERRLLVAARSFRHLPEPADALVATLLKPRYVRGAPDRPSPGSTTRA